MISEEKKAYMKKYREDNKDKLKLYAFEYRKKYYNNNKNEILLLKKEYYKKNKIIRSEYDKNYKKLNKDKVSDIRKIYANNFPEKKSYHQALRRSNKLSATPFYANLFFIKEAYSLAKLRTKMTGIEWSVDHIVPLKGKLVCGLHVHNNLQVITNIENMKKGNRFV